jgi:BlaI family penicillinase repressor
MSKLHKPTESELELLSILWDKGNATVREVHEIVLLNKEVGYTTTLKLMQIMHEKGLVTRDVSSKTHVYTPIFGQLEAQELYLGMMIKTLFNGSSAALVMHALKHPHTTGGDVEAIKTWINDIVYSSTS